MVSFAALQLASRSPQLAIIGEMAVTSLFLSDKYKYEQEKKKVDETFDLDYDYVYGIISTGTDWYFILHSTEVSIVRVGLNIKFH